MQTTNPRRARTFSFFEGYAVHKPDYSIVVDAAGPEGAARVAVGGELDLAAAEPLRTTLEAEMRAGRDVLLDLGDVEFIDSSGLCTVVAVVESARAQGRRLDIAAQLSEPVRRLAGLTRTLDRLPLARG